MRFIVSSWQQFGERPRALTSYHVPVGLGLLRLRLEPLGDDVLPSAP
jgi:hypothetical protein